MDKEFLEFHTQLLTAHGGVLEALTRSLAMDDTPGIKELRSNLITANDALMVIADQVSATLTSMSEDGGVDASHG